MRCRPACDGNRSQQRMRDLARLSTKVRGHINTSTRTRYSFTCRKRSALLTTDTELKLIASAAIIGDSIQPSHG